MVEHVQAHLKTGYVVKADMNSALCDICLLGQPNQQSLNGWTSIENQLPRGEVL